jgi:hypothetical protein
MSLRFLQATVGGLHLTQPPSVRIGAVRAVFGFCNHLKTTGNVQLLAPYLDSILEGLVTVATQFSAEVLGLCLETLSVVVTVSQGVGNHNGQENTRGICKSAYLLIIVCTST